MKIIILLAMTLLSVADTQASYFRFWRGYMQEEMTSQEFTRALNSKMLPETGKLASTSAQLLSYHPVMPTLKNISRYDLPHEMALVEYESQESYNTYRNTRNGRAYSDLHWDVFSRGTSKSAVPETFRGALEFGKSYQIVTAANSWNNYDVTFNIYVRKAGVSDSEYALALRGHLEKQKKPRPAGLIVLIDRNYMLEFVANGDNYFKPQKAFFRAMNAPMKIGRTIDFGKGVQYPL